MKPVGLWFLLVCLVISGPLARAGTVRVAVSSNFAGTLRDLAGSFEQQALQLRDTPAAQVMVRLKAGEADLLARVTRKSAMALELAPGKTVFAQVKSVALLG